MKSPNNKKTSALKALNGFDVGNILEYLVSRVLSGISGVEA